ncbi:MAG: hypothetical protein Q7U04_16105 [Bacteriovorax sp.]|nr:hypothetical protein [Bacteriovorax sp.]
MKRTLIILCLLLAFSGCGKLRNQRIFGKLPGIVKDTAGQEAPSQRALTVDEAKIALRICNSLQAKRNNLTSALTGKVPVRVGYIFNLERKNCKAKVDAPINITAEILFVGKELEYNSQDSQNIFPDVITEQTPALEDLCKSVLAKEVIISNASPLIKNNFYIMTFKTDLGFDNVQIDTKTANATGGFSATNSQLITIYTDVSQVPDIRNIGVEKERILTTPCTGSGVATQKETFIRSVFL